MSPPEFGVGDANENCPPDFQKYRSKFTKTPFQGGNHFLFWGGGIDSSPVAPTARL